MFHTELFYLMLAIGIIALGLSIKRYLTLSIEFIELHSASRAGILHKSRLILPVLLVPGVMLLILALYTGASLAPKINNRYIFFEALLNGVKVGPAFQFEFLPALLAGIGSFGALYLFEHNLRPALIRLFANNNLALHKEIEKGFFLIDLFRFRAGGTWRALFDGIYLTLIYRWGLQSLAVAVFYPAGKSIGGSPVAADLAHITGVVVAAAGQSILTAMAARSVTGGLKNTKAFILAAINFSLVPLVSGVMFWKFGIFAAMVTTSLTALAISPGDQSRFKKTVT